LRPDSETPCVDHRLLASTSFSGIINPVIHSLAAFAPANEHVLTAER
jgi:hypothetical protein